MPRPLSLALALLALASLAAARPRFPDEPNRASLPAPSAVQEAADVPLGTVIVTVVPVAPARNLTDKEELRAAVLSGVAMATDWLSVGDATAVIALPGVAGAVAAAASNATAAAGTTTSSECGSDGESMTYVVPLAPAVLPTASQAAQLTDGVAKAIDKQLRGVSLPARVVNASVTLDAGLFRDQAAPFPANARDGSGNIMLGWLRATGIGMDLCPPGVGLLAVRTLSRENLVTSVAAIEAAATNGTSRARGLPEPARLHNVANARIGERERRKRAGGKESFVRWAFFHSLCAPLLPQSASSPRTTSPTPPTLLWTLPARRAASCPTSLTCASWSRAFHAAKRQQTWTPSAPRPARASFLAS